MTALTERPWTGVDPHGVCLECGAEGIYKRGHGGEPATISWPDGTVEPWPTSSNPTYCPACWKEILTEREVRARAFHGAPDGTPPEPAWKRNGVNGVQRDAPEGVSGGD